MGAPTGRQRRVCSLAGPSPAVERPGFLGKRHESPSLVLQVAKLWRFPLAATPGKKSLNAYPTQRYRRTIAQRSLDLTEELPWTWRRTPSHADCFRTPYAASYHGLGPLFQSRPGGGAGLRITPPVSRNRRHALKTRSPPPLA